MKAVYGHGVPCLSVHVTLLSHILAMIEVIVTGPTVYLPVIVGITFTRWDKQEKNGGTATD